MDEKLKTLFECCIELRCSECPLNIGIVCYIKGMIKNYIDSLEERISIMQESIETLEERCKALEALEQRCKVLEKRNEPIEPIKPEELWICGACGKGTVGWDDWIIGDTRNNYCPNCGQAVKWDD